MTNYTDRFLGVAGSNVTIKDLVVTGSTTGVMPVGSIVQSILTLIQFQAQVGVDWVLMDGGSIVGSELATITGWTTVPDASGKFLRTAGSAGAGMTAEALAVRQEQATAKNSLELTGNVTASLSGNVSHNLGVAGASLGVPETNGGAGPATNPGAYLMVPGYSNTGPANTGWSGSINHGHSLSGGVDKGTLAASASNGNLAVGPGATETRPVNLTVNTFIKIN